MLDIVVEESLASHAIKIVVRRKKRDLSTQNGSWMREKKKNRRTNKNKNGCCSSYHVNLSDLWALSSIVIMKILLSSNLSLSQNDLIKEGGLLIPFFHKDFDSLYWFVGCIISWYDIFSSFQVRLAKINVM